MASFTHISVLILVLCLYAHHAEARGPIMRFTSQFETWYPQFGETFQELLDTKCQPEYQNYLYGTLSNTSIDWVRGADQNNLFTQPVIECILDETSEYIKSSLSSAQIILGLTPTVLALIGASSEESALMAIIGKRPFLTFLLSVSSPSVHLTRAFEYRDPQEVLHDPRGRHQHKLGNPRPTLLSSRKFIFGEYVLVLAALVNVGFINWDLSRRATCTLFSELTFMPALWAVIVVFIHATGVGVLRLRVRRTTEHHDESPTKWPWDWVRRRMASEFRKGLPREFCTVAYQDGGKIFVDWFPETRLFIGLTWFLSIGNVVHIVFGTLVFSGMTFVGPRDALQIFGRYMASALACRIILTHELAGLKDAYNAGLDVEAEGSEHWRCERKVDCHGCGGRRDADMCSSDY